MQDSPTQLSEAEIFRLERPHIHLQYYYFLGSLLLGPLFFIPMIPLLFRFRSLRYRFDDEGVSMRWGVLFRREIHLTYARIQDIHLTSNLVERWLGLARIEIQTASGSAKAEMTIEGILEFEAVRDFLYQRMRGVKGRADVEPAVAGPAAAQAEANPQLAATLSQIAEELRALRVALEGQPPEPPP